MKYLCYVFLLGIISTGFVPAKQEFYISPSGNDSNTGNKRQPFATLERAWQEAVNISRESQQNMTIWIREGIYRVDKPVVFNPDDQTVNVQITFKAYKNEKPVISGGLELTGWERARAKTWKVAVPEAVRKGFRELFINDQRAIRARFPNEGYLRVKQAGADRRTNFFFEKSDFPVPAYPADAELVLLHDWSISRIGVKEIDTLKNNLVTVDSIGAKKPEFFAIDNWEKNPRYFLENAKEFLDADYEWFYDKREGMVYLNLPENINPDEYKITVPVSEGILILKGKENQPIRNVHFEGITFSFSSWLIPEKGYCGIQACHFDPRPSSDRMAVVPSAVISEWAENCSFTNCQFKHLGGGGLSIGIACRSCVVEGTDFEDISGNGIMIGEGNDRLVNGGFWWKTVPDQAASGNIIRNCSITGCGKQFSGAVGIWCGLVAKTVISSNEISYLPYSGISIGWEWSPQPTPCRENQINNNHIHHIMQVLSDGGGIYMLGLQPGSRISGNLIHDVEVNAGRAESNGMFLDEGITDVVVENNFIYNIARSPLRFHKATRNLVLGNYLFCRDGVPPIRYNRTIEDDIQKVGNKVYSEKDENYKTILDDLILKWGKE